MAELTSNGIRFHVQHLGSGGRRVVFLHGLVMDNLSSWYFTVATRASKVARVLLYDLRGHGKSERPSTGYDVPTMVADLHGLLEQVSPDEPVELVGNSFGGLLAVAFAVAHPDRVSGLALVDGHISAQGWGDQMASTLELEGSDADQAIADNFKSWLGRHSERKRNRLAETARGLVHGTSLIADLRASEPITDPELGGLSCPMLLVYGADSDILHHGERLAAVAPSAQLVVLPGCSHSVIWEATEQVRDRLLGWLARPAQTSRQGGTG